LLLGRDTRESAREFWESDMRGELGTCLRRSGAIALFALGMLVPGVGSAVAGETHVFQETFGSAVQPSFGNAEGIAVDQSSGAVLVMDATSNTLRRFNPDGSPADFSALGSNAIDGSGGEDATPQGALVFGSHFLSQVAIDDSGGTTDGNIYLTNRATGAQLINVFAATGKFLGQLTAAGAGAFTEVRGVTVDSAGVVYVSASIEGGAFAIHKFVPSANPPVNADYVAPSFTGVSNPSLLAAGSGPTTAFLFARISGEVIAKIEKATGTQKYIFGSEVDTLSVDPSTGHPYIGSRGGVGTPATIREFDASGAASATLVSSFPLASTPQGIAIDDTTGELYISRAGDPNVEVFGPLVTIPDVVTGSATNIGSTTATFEGTVNPDGVPLTECFFEYGTTTAYGQSAPCESPNAAEVGAGSSPVAVHADVEDLEIGAEYHFRLVAANANDTVEGFDKTFKLESPPVIVDAWAADVIVTEATLAALIHPEGFDSTYRFEYIDDAGFQASGFGGAQSVPVPDGAIPKTVTGKAKETKGSAVLIDFVANSGAFEVGQSITGTGIPAGTTILAVDLAERTLTLSQAITSLGTKVNRNITATGAQPVSQFIDGLSADTTYHWRVVAANAIGVREGEEHTFITYAIPPALDPCPNDPFRLGPGALLAECRAYEMVSPIDKEGSDIQSDLDTFGNPTARNQSDPTGDKLTYSAERRFGDAVSQPKTPQYIATRDPALGWLTHGISPPRGLISGPGSDNEFAVFSEDLCSAWLINNATNAPPLADGGAPLMENLYERSNCGGDAYRWLTAAFGEVQGVSVDGEQVVFRSGGHLSQDAATPLGTTLLCGTPPGASSRTFRWLRDGVPISGALTQEYTTTNASTTTPPTTTGDAGSVIQCQATQTNTNAGTTQISNPAWVIAPYPGSEPPLAPDTIEVPSTDAPLDVGGAGGQTLTCDPGEWGGVPSLAYQWYRNGAQIAGASAQSYEVQVADLTGTAAFQCEVIATNPGGTVAKVSENALTTPAPSAPSTPLPQARGIDTNLPQAYLLEGEGEAHAICVLPSGTLSEGCTAGTATKEIDGYRQSVIGAMSADGARVFWSRAGFAGGASRIFLRTNPAEPQSALDGEGHCTEPEKACTTAVSDVNAQFWAAASDGSKAIYRTGNFTGGERGDLYEFDVGAGVGSKIAGGVSGRLGASEDGSRIYFASTEVCSADPNSEGDIAQAGEPNLYFYESGESCAAGELEFIATLAAFDARQQGGDESVVQAPSALSMMPVGRWARVSPDGATAAFVSVAPLTGFDNRDAKSREPTTEVFRYEAASDELSCVSCNPTGGRPAGQRVIELFEGRDYWAAAQIPPYQHQLYATRALSDDGSHLFFESFDSLVLGDTNGRKDVYEWIEVDGADEATREQECGDLGAQYFARVEGCLALLSSGKGKQDSGFVEATPDGSDVFFSTGSSLIEADPGLIDIYDARIGGGFPPPTPPTPPCEGEACQGAPPPPARAPRSSATFQGAENLPPQKKARRCPKGKRKVRRKGKVRCVRKHRRGAHSKRRAQR
jgi:hypothetical protein